jgi:hypothetical protein
MDRTRKAPNFRWGLFFLRSDDPRIVKTILAPVSGVLAGEHFLVSLMRRPGGAHRLR